jgi:hypothetical protein
VFLTQTLYPGNIKDPSQGDLARPRRIEGNIAMRILCKNEPLWPTSLAPPGVEKLGEEQTSSTIEDVLETRIAVVGNGKFYTS